MYYQNYEDYMRSVLGYSIEPQNTYEPYNYQDVPYEMSQMRVASTMNNSEIMDLYPEIYKIVNPMVCKICEANTKPITRELIDRMTDEIYMNLEAQPDVNTVVNVKVNTAIPLERQEKSNRVSNNVNSSSTSSNSALNRNSKSRLESTGKAESSEKRESIENREDRQRRPNDNILRDLIRILILNRLLGGNFPHRPPRPPMPRPPMRPPMRPPFQRNEGIYEDYFM